MRVVVVLFASFAACGGVTSGETDGGNGDGGQGTDAGSIPNIVFTTSTTTTGDLGGLVGADEICNARARGVGLPGNYAAWISTSTVDARDRFAGASGWVRTDGLPFANTVDELLAGRVYYPPNRDENGVLVEERLWTATRVNGRLDPEGSCNDWTAAAGASTSAGHSAGGHVIFTAESNRNCTTPAALLCMGLDRRASIAAPSDAGRLAFVSGGRVSGGEGLAAMDSLCVTEATAAGLGTGFKAAAATGGAPISSRFNTSGETWVRADGTKLFESAADVAVDGEMLAPIMLRADGTLGPETAVWTGANGFSAVEVNCTDFTTTAGDGVIGKANMAGLNGLIYTGQTCSVQLPVYCFQE